MHVSHQQQEQDEEGVGRGGGDTALALLVAACWHLRRGNRGAVKSLLEGLGDVVKRLPPEEARQLRTCEKWKNPIEIRTGMQQDKRFKLYLSVRKSSSLTSTSLGKREKLR